MRLDMPGVLATLALILAMDINFGYAASYNDYRQYQYERPIIRGIAKHDKAGSTALENTGAAQRERDSLDIGAGYMLFVRSDGGPGRCACSR